MRTLLEKVIQIIIIAMMLVISFMSGFMAGRYYFIRERPEIKVIPEINFVERNMNFLQ